MPAALKQPAAKPKIRRHKNPGLRHRCITICSSEKTKLQELEHLKKRCFQCQDTPKQPGTSPAARNPPLTPPDPQQTRKKGHITLPYVGHVTGALARTIRKAGVTVHMKPYNNIRSHLVRPKDKVPKEGKSRVIYQIKCGDCPASYVGETARQLKEQVAEHLKITSSPMREHLPQAEHSFTTEEVSVLHQEPEGCRRGVAEAIHFHRESPSPNRDRGRHNLPAIYRR